jgi:large subunit ribosomal protein L30
VTRLRVTQVRSVIDRPKDQKDTVRRLGLHRMHDTVVKEDRPDIRGMLEKVRHLVRVDEVGETDGEAKIRDGGKAR